MELLRMGGHKFFRESVEHKNHIGFSAYVAVYKQ